MGSCSCVRPWTVALAFLNFSSHKKAGILLALLTSRVVPELSVSCPTLCDSVECSSPGSSVHGIFPGKNTGASCHFLLQGDLPDPAIQSMSPASPE